MAGRTQVQVLFKNAGFARSNLHILAALRSSQMIWE